MIKHLAVSALALFAFIGVANAQNTVLGPNMTAVTAAASATMAALPANPSRKAVTICNGSATIVVTFTTGTLTPVAGTTGIVLPAANVATSCFTIGNPASGPGASGVGAQINIIAASTTAPVTFIEYF